MITIEMALRAYTKRIMCVTICVKFNRRSCFAIHCRDYIRNILGHNLNIKPNDTAIPSDGKEGQIS